MTVENLSVLARASFSTPSPAASQIKKITLKQISKVRQLSTKLISKSKAKSRKTLVLILKKRKFNLSLSFSNYS